MNKIMLISVILLCCMVMQSCIAVQNAPAEPVRVVVERERIIEKPFDVVWEKILELLATYNMPIKNIDRSSGFIATDYKLITGDPAQYMYCTGASSTFSGKVELTNHGANLNVLLKKITDTSTKVTLNLFYSCLANKYRYAGFFSTEYVLESSTRIDCSSTGNLEKAVFIYLSAVEPQTSPETGQEPQTGGVKGAVGETEKEK